MPTLKQPEAKAWQHRPEPKRNRVTDPFYVSSAWRKFRKIRMAEEPLCRECYTTGKLTAATLLDHITPIEDGGDRLTKENTQPLCNSCHAIKSAKEGHQRGRGR